MDFVDVGGTRQQAMKKILEIDVANLNAMFRQNGVQAVHVPDRR